LGATALAGFAASGQLALAASAEQQAAASTAPDAPIGTTATGQDTGAIVVTARHRNESIVDVPISISVVTADTIQQLGLTNTTEIANYVPSLTFNSYTPGDARNDRGPDRPLVIRGLDINGSNGGAQAAGLFLDGAAVIGNEVPAGMDIGQVEVLRGPQSVYFGRATMTGAVSYRTRSISDEWHGEFEAIVADKSERDIQATIAGPVIPGLLKMRLTGLSESYGGYMPNSYPGAQNLGATSRNSLSLTAILTPASNLEIKGYVNYFRDNDGPSATATIPSTFANCTYPGSGIPATADSPAIPVYTFCGKIPSSANSIGYINPNPPAGVLDYLYNSTPVTANQGFQERVGTQRAVLNSSIVATWGISDYLKLNSITGYHTNHDVSVDDGEPEPVSASLPAPAWPNGYYYDFAERREDFSQELRLTSDPRRKFSWTFGGNYIHQQQLATAAADVPGVFTYAQAATPTDAYTVGVFGGVYFKPIDKLTLAAEGRYQNDKIKQSDGVELLSVTTNSFSPRISAEYDIGGNRRIYTSFAQGDEPAGLNPNVALQGNNLPAAEQAAYYQEIAQKLGGVSSSYKEEVLRVGELGVKGNVFGTRGFFDLNFYYGGISNQQIQVSAQITELNNNSVSATDNAGKAKFYGIEWQGSYTFTPELSLRTSFSWNHTERTQFINSAGPYVYGTTNFNGTAFAFVPQYQGSAVLAYSHQINDVWRAYGNASLTYRGKQFVDDFNSAYIPDRFEANLRVGVQHGTYSLEIFVKNLFNNVSYTGGSIAPNYGQANNYSYSFFGAYAPPRQLGVRLLAKF
jgi:iron complex outermembrane receptor protein